MESKRFCIVVKYEVLVILRDLLFKLLAFLGIAGVFFLQYVVQGDNPYNWDMVAFTSSMPIVNAYLYNWVQCFLVLFFAAELHTRERAGSSLEVIHARPEGNGDYFMGKMAGMVAVFGGMNVLVIFICMFIQVFMTSIPFNPFMYFFYLITQTLPSLVFMIGFTVFVAYVTRSRVLAILVSLVLLYFSAGGLQEWAWGAFDMLGVSLASVFSEVEGFPHLGLYLLQRLFVGSAGMGLMFWSAYRLERLPSGERNRRAVMWSGVSFSVLALVLVGCYTWNHVEEDRVREDYRASFARYWKQRTCRVGSHAIEFRQAGSEISLRSELVARNPNREDLENIVLFLNPGLRVSEVLVEGEEVAFERDNQVVVLRHGLAAGDSVKVEMEYEGKIDERYCYLDMPDLHYRETGRGNDFLNFGRRYALVSDRYLLLTPETGWYPVAIPTSNPEQPFLGYGDFTRFRLRVVEPRQPMVLSQGIARKRGDTLTFEQPLPIEGVSLCGGKYEHRRLALRGLNLDFYYFRGHDVLTPAFKMLSEEDVREVVESVCTRKFTGGAYHVGITKQFYDSIEETFAGQAWYDFPGGKTLRFVETPSVFAGWYRVSSRTKETVQPGMVFLGERGQSLMTLSYMKEKKGKNPEEWKWIEKDRLGSLLRASFHGGDDWYKENPFLYQLKLREQEKATDKEWKPYCTIGVLDGRHTRLYSEEFPEVDVFFRLCDNTLTGMKGMVKEMSTRSREWQCYLLEHGMRGFMKDRSLSAKDLFFIAEMSSSVLFNLLGANIEQENLEAFMDDFYANHIGKEVPLEEFIRACEERFGMNFWRTLVAWRDWRPTTYLVQNMGVERVPTKERKFRGYFQIMNTGQDSGVISVRYQCFRDITSCNVIRNYVIAPGEVKEIKFKDGQFYNFEVSLGISRNMPNVLIPERENEVTNNRWKIAEDTVEGVFVLSPEIFAPLEGEILVDNRDEGFRLISPPGAWLERVRESMEAERYRDVYLSKKVTRWTRFFASSLQGDSIRDAYYKPHGEGKFKAEWSTEIEEPGKYEVFAFLYTSAVHVYTVYCGDEETEIVLNEGQFNHRYYELNMQGWRSLGTYDFPVGKARVVLDDRGEDNGMFHQVVVADAVKWVKVKS